ncbi:hypothetical protein FOL47_002262 [Perkinsus chesapeaki]|uniref:Uncharacterized protein n=1 Tax=Perkinsus chesapeaki TaxID=330153 RepID=A0A7J6N143_PERCH|nr:hypothetical protein FOL47_002262 [Perkinsus chesapeaki]
MQGHHHHDVSQQASTIEPPTAGLYTTTAAAAVGVMPASGLYASTSGHHLAMGSLRPTSGSGSLLAGGNKALHSAASGAASYLGQCLTLGQLHTLAGATASFVAVISSYPLDLMKNRVASASLYKSPLDCMRITWKNEGFKGRNFGN